MKAEHRKELQTNVLADRVGKILEEVKAGPNTTVIVVIVVALLVVGLYIGWQYYSTTSQNNRAALWVKLQGATNAEDLADIAKNNERTMPGRIARYQEARLKLRLGLEKLCADQTKDRTEALEKVKEAGDLYVQLVGETKDAVLLQEALIGVAKARESQGDLDSALDYYKKLLNQKPDGMLVKEAEAAVKRLEPGSESRAKVDSFYAELKKLNEAKTAANPTPSPTLPPPTLPPDLPLLPPPPPK
jgi:tetratricopeptide (TPR) repeat protein